jgi:hypothetical protein
MGAGLLITAFSGIVIGEVAKTDWVKEKIRYIKDTHPAVYSPSNSIHRVSDSGLEDDNLRHR